MDIYFAGGTFRAKSKFGNIAKISSTRKIRVIQYFVLMRSSSQVSDEVCDVFHNGFHSVDRTFFIAYVTIASTHPYMSLTLHMTTSHVLLESMTIT